MKTLASGDNTPAEGDTVSYDIVVTNNGSAQATGVSLVDTLPPGITFVSNSVTQGSYDATTGVFSIGTLAAGDSATLTLTGTVDVGQGGNSLTNITTAATGDQPDPSTAGDDLEETVTIEADADLVTIKSLASGDNTPVEGDTVVFEIEVTNNGSAQATGVSLTDTLPAGITFVSNSVTQGSYDANTGLFTIGILAAGDSAVLTLTGTVDVGQGGNTLTNITTAATGDQPDPSSAGDDLEESVFIGGVADLVTIKTLPSGDNTPAEGDTVVFQIEITNNGQAQATGVSLTDTLPSGITFASSSVTQGSYDANTGLFTIGTLAVGDTAILTLTGTVDIGQGGNTLTNITTAATGDQPDPSSAGDDLEEAVTIEADADLVTIKSLASGDNTPAEGDTVTFQIEVTNNGSAQATNVSLTDTLPAGITFASSSVTQGSYDATTGLFTIGTLAAGDSASLTLSGTVDFGQGSNTLTNVTTAATGDQPDPSTAGDDLEEAVFIGELADLVTIKTLASGDNTPAEGDTVTFQIEVTNNGQAQATGVSLTDTLPPGITFASSSVTQGSYDTTTGLFTIGTLAVGDTAILTLTGTVDVGQGGNAITNVTSPATGDQPDPTTVGDNLDETIDVDPNADLVTVKTLASGDNTPDEGDTVIFEIEVTNEGTAQATGVSLTDSLPAGITFVSSTVSQGSYDSTTGLFTIGTLGAGQSATILLEGTVDVGQGGNSITNVTTAATGDQPDPSTVGDELLETVDVNADANLITVKTLASGDNTPAEGDTVVFQIEVTNNGGAHATNVSLTDQLPAGITFVSSSVTQGSYDSATGLFTIGTLNTGDSATLTLSGTVDAGQGGNFITNTTTVATGDQPDPSTAGDDLTESVDVDNEADLVTVKTLASGDATPDEGDTVTFQIEVTNNGAAQATNVSLIDSLPAGITFTGSTVSQGVYNSATGLFDIGTLNAGDTATLTLTGTVDAGQAGNPITNITTAATGDQPDPTNAGNDLEETVSVDPLILGVDPLIVADLGLAKSVVGEPVLTELGNFVVTFQLVVENTGNVDLANLSLLEDISTQFGPAFVSAGNLVLTSLPSDPASNIAVDSAFNGQTVIELIDSSGGTLLTTGDSFTLQFDVEIDPRAVSDPLENQVEGSGDAVDANGNPILDSSGNPITGTDLSDSGTDPTTSNPGDPADNQSADDPTPFDPPPVPLGVIAGTVFQDDNGDGIQQIGEAGIAGVEITLTGTDVFGNPVETTVLTDANGVYEFTELNAGTYSVEQTQPEGFTDGEEMGDSSFTIENDRMSNIQLGFGQSFRSSTFAEQVPTLGATGNPPRLPGFLPFNASRISNLIGGFLGGPGPIYSGTPISTSPVSGDAGIPVTGGYSIDPSETGDGIGDCGCPEPINPCCVPVDACGNPILNMPGEQVIMEEGSATESVIEGDIQSFESFDTSAVDVEEGDTDEVVETETVAEELTSNESINGSDSDRMKRPSFLKRIANWLNV